MTHKAVHTFYSTGDGEALPNAEIRNTELKITNHVTPSVTLWVLYHICLTQGQREWRYLWMAVQKGWRREHNEAGDRDMNEEAVCVSRNAQMRTRPRQWSKSSLGKTWETFQGKTTQPCVWLAQGENWRLQDEFIFSSLVLFCCSLLLRRGDSSGEEDRTRNTDQRRRWLFVTFNSGLHFQHLPKPMGHLVAAF